MRTSHFWIPLSATLTVAVAGCSGDGASVSEGNRYRGTYFSETAEGPKQLVVRADGMTNGTFTYRQPATTIEVHGTVTADGTFTGTYITRSAEIGERREAAEGTLKLEDEELTFTVYRRDAISQSTSNYYLRRR